MKLVSFPFITAKKAIMAAALSICNMVTAQAAIISQDYINAGDGLLTQDTIGQMEWLDVSLFTNWNLNTVTSSNAYTQDGFHLATDEEVFTLFQNAGLGYIFDRTGNLDFGEVADGNTAESKYALSDLHLKLGGNHINFRSNGNTFISGVVADDDNDKKMNVASLSANKNQALINSSSDSWGPMGSYSYMGAWYVREMSEVPVPSSSGIFVLGLMALGLRHFKRHA